MSEPCPFELPPGLAPRPGRHPDAPGPVPYIASQELIEAVNLAIHLNRPLLLEGEAGSGKSQLAKYVAHCLGLPFYPWLVRSTSSAQDGLYSYDAILRLHDVHLAQLKEARSGGVRIGRTKPGSRRDPRDPMAYVSWGALGKAFQRTDRPAVVLIDEIDKADIDFPNDLLTVLDDPREFRIREVDLPPIRATLAPIIIITSNKEKGNLPQPFLRRCIYSYIRFPSAPDQLKRIIAAHQRSTERPVAVDDRLTDAAVGRFLDLRDKDDLFKKPGTSELLDWLQALARAVLRGNAGGQEAAIGELVARLESPEAPLPFPELLFKLQADWRRYVPAAER